MRKILIIAFLTISLFSCKNKFVKETKSIPKQETVTSEVLNTNIKDNFDIETILINSILDSSTNQLLKDTVVESFQLKYKEISKEGYVALKPYINNGKIPTNIGLSENIINTDSSYIIQLANGLFDTLKNYVSDEYFERYKIISDWDEKNQLLIKYENWEENSLFLYNKTDGSTYNLGVEYSLSENLNWLLYYINVVDQPLYSNCFGIAFLDSLTIKPIIDLNEMTYTFRNAGWINDSLAVAHLSTFNYELDGFYDEDFYYLIQVKN